MTPPGAARRPSAAAGHCGEDDQGVALPHRRLEAVEHAHVLVVEVDVDVAVELALGGEELRARLRVGRREVVEHLADGRALGGDFLLAADGRPQHGWDLDGGHGGSGPYPAAAQNAS